MQCAGHYGKLLPGKKYRLVEYCDICWRKRNAYVLFFCVFVCICIEIYLSVSAAEGLLLALISVRRDVTMLGTYLMRYQYHLFGADALRIYVSYYFKSYGLHHSQSEIRYFNVGFFLVCKNYSRLCR